MKTLICLNNPDLRSLIFHNEVIERLEQFSQVDWLEDYDKLEDCIGEYDVCISSWGSPRLTTEILKKAKKLKFVGHAAGTVLPYMDESIFGREITVVNANRILSKATAEGAVAMMAAWAYSLPKYDRMLRSGGWANNDVEWVPGLSHQTIGLIGYGDISKEVIRLLEPYSPEILLCSSHCSEEEASRLGVRLCGLDELLSSANIVSLHNTLTPKTKGMIGKQELEKMKEGAILLNTARAAIIDEEALLETLRTGKIGAIMDVYEQEPLPMDHPFRSLSNVWLFPHIAAYSGYWKKQLGLSVVENLEKFLKGEAVNDKITLEKYRRMTPV